MNQITSTARYIYTCTNKSCKHVYALDFDVTSRRDGASTYVMQNPPEWINPNRTRYNPPSHATCPKCGHFAKYNFVRGRHSDTPCDHRCTSAKGHTCDCSCGGANHGRDYLPGVH